MKKNTQIFVLALIMFLCLPLFGQDTYIVISNRDVYKIESDYSLTYIYTHQYGVADIALSPNNAMYGIYLEGEIYEIDMQTGAFTLLAVFPFEDYYDIPSHTSLVCSDDNELFSLADNGELYKYNIEQDTTELVAYLGESTPGDLTFYKGNLIFQNSTTGHFQAYNIENDMLSTVVCNFSPILANVYGISNIFNTCDSEQILATDNEDNLFELDIENGTIEFITNYEQFDSPAGYPIIYGMTSSSEHQASTCEIFTFADIDCTTVNVEEAISEPVSIYPNPANDIVFIEAPKRIDYIDVFSIGGKKINRIHSGTNKIDVSDLPTGVYLLQIYSNNNYFTKKILIEK